IRLIGVYKKEIIKFLEFNNCYDAPIFIPDHIYKLNELKMQLSFAQERVWFIERYEGGTHAYNIPLVFKLKDLVDIGILERSIGEIVRRHEVLRTVICEDGEGRGYQEVLDHDTHPILLRIKEVHGRKDLDEVILEEVRHVFDLSKEHPIRINLYNVSESQDRYLSIVCHHIAFDGWSVDIFCKELESFYDYFMGEREGVEKVVDIVSLPIQYKDFALWQKSYLTGERLEKQLNYWRGELAGYETLNLITDNPRPSKIDYRGADVHFEIDEKVSAGLRSLAKELKVSLYSLLLSGYYLLLRAYSNQDDIVIGSPIANRHYSQIENLIGFFVNTLALRCTIKSDLLLCDFIKMVGSKVVEAQSYQDLPFEKLVDALNIDKDMSRHPIFQVCFGLQGFGGMDEGKILAPYITDTSFYNIAKFDLSTSIDDRGGRLKGSFNYAISLYNEDTISGFSRTYQIILNQISSLASDASKQGALRISDLSYLPKEEYKKIIYDWNATDKPYPNHSTIHGLFEEQVLRTPDNIAVVYGSTRLTYRELNIRANRLAHYLVEQHKVGPESLVILCLDRSEHMIISMFAILKAGGAYVPIDPAYPDDRIEYIVNEI
ncbi:MAG: hypothetical protein EB127_22185, partial [Alphaproteobacteria bacterium]|nr:hypothetical protein [Alphaproteobacteria bacterium]